MFALAMINISTILSIRNWPFTAEYGLASITYLILATLLYFVPIALISAELATGWPKRGGIFAWISEAFGPRIGFVAVFLLWASNIVFYPALLSFISATIAYSIHPPLAENAYYQFFTVVGVFWAILLLSLRGMHLSSWLSKWGVLLGTLLPGSLIVGFGILWYFSGNELAIPFSWESCVPKLQNLDELVFISGVLLGFAGMEMTAVHAMDVENPQKNYPRAIFSSAVIIVLLSLMGTVAVAIVIPQEKIGLLTASLETLSIYLAHYKLGFLMPILALLVAFGSVGGISTWLAGPSKGLQAACEEVGIRNFFSKTNRGMPTAIMLIQGVVVTIVTALYLVMPSVNSSFWVFTVLSVQMYLIVYFLLFLSAIVLKYTHPHVERHYEIPGKKLGMWIVALLGLANTAFCFTIGFLPPAQLDVGSRSWYLLFLIGGTLISALIPYFMVKSPRKISQERV